jgi:hypothetical protein
MMSPERSLFFERDVPLRGGKMKKEHFGFRLSTGEKDVASFRGVKNSASWAPSPRSDRSSV